jgi:hypothetical protein
MDFDFRLCQQFDQSNGAGKLLVPYRYTGMSHHVTTFTVLISSDRIRTVLITYAAPSNVDVPRPGISIRNAVADHLENIVAPCSKVFETLPDQTPHEISSIAVTPSENESISKVLQCR